MNDYIAPPSPPRYGRLLVAMAVIAFAISLIVSLVIRWI